MRQMMDQYKRPDVRQIAILLTDGFSTIDRARTIPEAVEAKAEQIELVVVGT